jgi:CRISPR-associated endoribonuclease Cas6
MRLHFLLSSNKKPVDFDYQHALVGVFHYWLGLNDLHNKISLYSLSWLSCGKMSKRGFDFPNGADWFVSFYDVEIGKKLIKTAMSNNEVISGMTVREIQIMEEPDFGSKERFQAASPILVRKYDENRRATHLTFHDEEADKLMTETMQKKLQSANLNYDIQIRFDRSYPNAKTKLVTIKGIENRANLCPIIIEGDPEAIKFAWNVGIGHSTGSGFGAIK